MSEKIRLDKFVASQTGMSRADAKKAIRGGTVAVNGTAVKNADMTVDTENDTVSMNGKVMSFKKFVYIMLNKPKGIVSASRSENDKTVIDLVPAELFRKGMFPAGRLDKDSTGFVLITDDGAFAHSVLSPSHHVPKTYLVTSSSELTGESMNVFRSGVPLSDGITKPAEIESVGFSCSGLPVYRVTLTEGRYHQIKRMFSCLGSAVVGLHRISFGGLNLDSCLSPGECRELSPDEVNSIANI